MHNILHYVSLTSIVAHFLPQPVSSLHVSFVPCCSFYFACIPHGRTPAGSYSLSKSECTEKYVKSNTVVVSITLCVCMHMCVGRGRGCAHMFNCTIWLSTLFYLSFDKILTRPFTVNLTACSWLRKELFLYKSQTSAVIPVVPARYILSCFFGLCLSF